MEVPSLGSTLRGVVGIPIREDMLGWELVYNPQPSGGTAAGQGERDEVKGGQVRDPHLGTWDGFEEGDLSMAGAGVRLVLGGASSEEPQPDPHTHSHSAPSLCIQHPRAALE